MEHLLRRLVDYMIIMDSGCPLGRHELKNEEWKLLGTIKAAREKIMAEEAEAKRKSQSMDRDS